MKQYLEDLFKFDRQLVGSGYDKALDYIGKILPMKVIGFRSGTKAADWIVPPEWVMRDGWVKFNGEKILDYKENPLSVMVYSLPVNKKMTRDELKEHLHVSEEKPSITPYSYAFYDRDWGFSIPQDKVVRKKEGTGEGKAEWEDLLPEGEYEVFIDAEDKPGIMKIGIHTIPGKSDREILLFAHLDHPHQANDNLSGVVCLMDLAEKLKGKYEHTIKIIFCPETIGSIAYATKMDISKVDFVVSVDSIGNDNTLLFQKAYDKFHRLNYHTHLAVAGQGIDYRKGDFRMIAGSEEYFFNDPQIGIPGIFLSRIPYPEYHTSKDTPEKINYEKIEEVEKVILMMIDFYEKDFIPKRNFIGPLMRSRHGIQTAHKSLNLNLDYLMYDIDGKKYLSEIVIALGLSFTYVYETLQVLIKKNVISRVNPGKVKKHPSPRKK